MAFLRKSDITPLVEVDKVRNPPRYDDLDGQNVLSALPTGWRVLMVLLCTVVALGFALQLLSHFQHF